MSDASGTPASPPATAPAAPDAPAPAPTAAAPIEPVPSFEALADAPPTPAPAAPSAPTLVLVPTPAAPTPSLITIPAASTESVPILTVLPPVPVPAGPAPSSPKSVVMIEHVEPIQEAPPLPPTAIIPTIVQATSAPILVVAEKSAESPKVVELAQPTMDSSQPVIAIVAKQEEAKPQVVVATMRPTTPPTTAVLETGNLQIVTPVKVQAVAKMATPVIVKADVPAPVHNPIIVKVEAGSTRVGTPQSFRTARMDHAATPVSSPRNRRRSESNIIPATEVPVLLLTKPDRKPSKLATSSRPVDPYKEPYVHPTTKERHAHKSKVGKQIRFRRSKRHRFMSCLLCDDSELAVAVPANRVREVRRRDRWLKAVDRFLYGRPDQPISVHMKRERIDGMDFEIVRNIPEERCDWHIIHAKPDNSEDSVDSLVSRGNEFEHQNTAGNVGMGAMGAR